MKLNIEEAENGFVVEEDPEILIDGHRMSGKKYVFPTLEETTAFITKFYVMRGHTAGLKKEET